MIDTTLAIVFPGQGSQSVGMLADIAAEYPEVKQTFAEASTVLGYDLLQMSLHGPAAELDKTMHTQPALLAASFAVWRILQTRSTLKPAILAGHSLGEYTALVCANALAFTDAVRLVAARGQFMQDAVPPGTGAMAAIIGMDDAAVAEICKHAAAGTDEILSPANFNSPGQIVIAGHAAAVERAIRLAKDQGARLAITIPVSVPSHCLLMRPAAERLAALLEKTVITPPQIPVINNVDAAPDMDPKSIRDALVRQLYMPVRWVESIQKIVQNGVTTILECGPGKVLTGLNKRIDKNLQLMTSSDLAGIQAFLRLENERSS